MMNWGIEALDSDAFYVGALGSRRDHARRVEGLVASGCNNEGSLAPGLDAQQ